MSNRCGSIEDMSENDSMHVQYSVFTLQQANHNKVEKKTLSKLVFMQFTFKVYGVVISGGGVCAHVCVCVSESVGGWVGGGVEVRVCGWVGGEVGVCYSTPLNCAVFVTEDVQVFSP